MCPRVCSESEEFIEVCNCVFAAGVYNGGLLFFTLNQGVVSVAHQSGGRVSRSMPPPPSSSSLLATPSLGLPATALSLSREASADKIEALKNAFLEYLGGNMVKCHQECIRMAARVRACNFVKLGQVRIYRQY